MTTLGLGNIERHGHGVHETRSRIRRQRTPGWPEQATGKDTTIGHWEMAGLIMDKPFPTYPHGFPKEVIDQFEEETRHGRRSATSRPPARRLSRSWARSTSRPAS